MVGKFVADAKLRDRVVIATKFTFNAQAGNPNAGGNGRKNVYRALEGSLRRLKTDYVDLYYLHAWDRVTPVEEVVNTLSDLIRAGKIRYYAFSDTPPGTRRERKLSPKKRAKNVSSRCNSSIH